MACLAAAAPAAAQHTLFGAWPQPDGEYAANLALLRGAATVPVAVMRAALLELPGAKRVVYRSDTTILTRFWCQREAAARGITSRAAFALLDIPPSLLTSIIHVNGAPDLVPLASLQLCDFRALLSIREDVGDTAIVDALKAAL